MIIDAHNHPDWYGHNAEKFIQNMDEYGIGQTWLLSWECPQDEYAPHYIAVTPEVGPHGPIPFAKCLQYARQYPDRFVLGYCPDPRRPEAIDRLKSAVATYGVKVCGELKLRMMYDDPDAIRMFHYCGEAGLPVTLHFDYEFPTGADYPRPNYWYGGDIGVLRRILTRCPETIFLGHAPGFWAHLSGDDQYDKTPYPTGPILPGGIVPQLMEEFPNLYCDLSAGSAHNALSRDKAFSKQFLTEYQDRVLYARDYFDNIHQELFNSLDLPASVLEKIYYKNAQRLVGGNAGK